MGSLAPTFGVEEEFLLVDAETGRPAERNVGVAAAVRASGFDLALEFARCQVEIDTGVHTSSAGLRAELSALRGRVAEAATPVGARLLAAGAPIIGGPPFAVTESDRFDRIRRCFGNLTWGQCICGTHVHVGMPDRETAVQVCNFIRPWLPALLALTANSAVCAGVDTGHASWRAVLQTGWPVSGPPPYFTSAEHYDRLLCDLQSTGAILEEHMAYWDIRPSSHLPTVEVRVSDVPATLEETVTLAVLVRALAMTALDELAAGRTAPRVGDEVLRAAKWKAARGGLHDDIYEVTTGRIVPARTVITTLITSLAPALEELGEQAAIEHSLQRRFSEGNGAVRQRAALRCGGIGEVLAIATAATVDDCAPDSPARREPH